MPLREAEQPVKSIVPLPLSTIPGSTFPPHKLDQIIKTVFGRPRIGWKLIWGGIEKQYLLGGEESADGGDGDGFLEGFDTNVGEVGWLIISERLVRIVHQDLHES